MKSKIFYVGIITLFSCASAFAQLMLPRDSQRAEVVQTVGDTKVSIVYHRPNIKGRKVWGDAPETSANQVKTLDGSTMNDKEAVLVTYGHVWRTGANENTTFETTNDITINGQMLPAGKYGLHSIPNKDEWTLIFSKVNNAWGSFNYDAGKDQLRVMAKPQTGEFQETLSLDLENIKPTTAEFVVRWASVRIPFKIDVGDVQGRTLAEIRNQVNSLKDGDFRTPVQGAGWVLDSKLAGSYPEALMWVDKSLAIRETTGGLSMKAQLLAASGKKADAIKTLEKAIQLGKSVVPPANTSNMEKMLADWKAGK